MSSCGRTLRPGKDNSWLLSSSTVASGFGAEGGVVHEESVPFAAHAPD